MRYNSPYRRNSDDLVFADTAEEALLPAHEIKRRQKGRQRAQISRNRAVRKAVQPTPVAARCLSMPTQQVIDKLTAYGPSDAKRGAIEMAGKLCPENIDQGSWKKLVNALEELSTRRRNPSQDSIPMLARRTLTKLRKARSKAGFDVFRRNPAAAPPAPAGPSKEIIEGLQALLSDTYILYIKTQNFHWNVTGPHFGALHKMFDDQYLELAAANDLIAERIRALGAFTSGSCAEFTKHSSLREITGDAGPDNALGYKNMIRELEKDHAQVAKECRNFLDKLDDLDDDVTSQMVADRALAHEKAAWMLKSHLV